MKRADTLQIVYKSNKMEKVCTSAYAAQKKYGDKMAAKIQQRVQEISAAETVEEMLRSHIGRCHPLQSNREGEYAVDLIHPYRLIFEKIENIVQIAKIIEIVNYH